MKLMLYKIIWITDLSIRANSDHWLRCCHLLPCARRGRVARITPVVQQAQVWPQDHSLRREVAAVSAPARRLWGQGAHARHVTLQLCDCKGAFLHTRMRCVGWLGSQWRRGIPALAGSLCTRTAHLRRHVLAVARPLGHRGARCEGHQVALLEAERLEQPSGRSMFACHAVREGPLDS